MMVLRSSALPLDCRLLTAPSTSPREKPIWNAGGRGEAGKGLGRIVKEMWHMHLLALCHSAGLVFEVRPRRQPNPGPQGHPFKWYIPQHVEQPTQEHSNTPPYAPLPALCPL